MAHVGQLVTMSSAVFLLCLLGVALGVPLKDAKDVKNTFIVDGEVATPGQFAYQAAVYMNSLSFCGGSLISTQWVLTAAHCVKGISTFTVFLGAHDMMAPYEESRQVFTTKVGIHHERYNTTTLEHDIGVINLYHPASFNANVSPVRLPSLRQMDNLFVNQFATVSGWGKISTASTTISPLKRFVQVKVISNEECDKNYDSEPIFPTTLCAQGEGKKSTCNGDSGGPLVFYEGDGFPTQIGVVSFVSDSGCDKEFPHGYSRLTSYMHWLQSVTKIPIRE